MPRGEAPDPVLDRPRPSRLPERLTKTAGSSPPRRTASQRPRASLAFPPTGTIRRFEPLPSTLTRPDERSRSPTESPCTSPRRRAGRVEELEHRVVAHRLVPLRRRDVEELGGLVRVERLRKSAGDLRGAHRARGVVVAPPFADKKVEQRAKRRQAPLDRAPGEPAPVAPGREPLDLHPGERRPAGLPRRREVVRRRREVPAIGIAGVRREPPLVGEVAHERVDRLHPGREGRFHAGRGGGSRAHRGPLLHASILRPARRRQPTGQVIRTARPAPGPWSGSGLV